MDSLKPLTPTPTPNSKQDILIQDPWSYILSVDESNPSKKRNLINRTNKNWNLVLYRNKLVLSNYPKPPGLLSQKERKAHLLNLLKIYMPGILNNPTDLAQVEYLYFNGFLARAVVSFYKGRLAKQVYKCREQLETSGIRISRYFKNEAPPIPLIPHIVNLPKTQHEIDQHVLIDINSAEDISKHPTGLVAKDSQRLDSLGPRYAENQGIDLDSFDNNLLYSYSVLPPEVQKEILHKIDTLYFCLTKVTEEQLRLPKQNMLDRDCGSDSVPRLYHQELDLWVGKAPTPTSQLVVAEMNPLFHILEAETLPPDPSTMHPISEANMTTTSAWDKMRELNESELGSPCKVPHMGPLTCNFINPLSSNVCKLNKSIDTIEPITEPAEPDQQMRDDSILFLAPKNDLVEDPTGRINKIIQTINDHSTSGTIPVDLNSLSLSNTPLILPSGSEKSTILGLTSAFSETSGTTLQPNHPNKSKQLGCIARLPPSQRKITDLFEAETPPNLESHSHMI
ncbi:Hypothetical predicted protein [Podarcis lilfordi]|uniref:Uncharacterized protein n=1 Tax=Podarcis lilfordi TaxID=74358 RepID=A0AA35PFN2_9SAUR|nr:Hypothetical predicted protein [Podarcis lilfordi]